MDRFLDTFVSYVSRLGLWVIAALLITMWWYGPHDRDYEYFKSTILMPAVLILMAPAYYYLLFLVLSSRNDGNPKSGRSDDYIALRCQFVVFTFMVIALAWVAMQILSDTYATKDLPKYNEAVKSVGFVFLLVIIVYLSNALLLLVRARQRNNSSAVLSGDFQADLAKVLHDIDEFDGRESPIIGRRKGGDAAD